MPDVAFVIFFGVLLALFVAMALYGARVERQRDQAYQAYAADHNFVYVPARDGQQQQYERWMGVFTHGSARHWRYEMSGTIGGRSFAAFEYRYSVSSGRSTTTYREAMFRCDLPGANLPTFTAAPTTFFDRVKEAFGAQDVDLADDVQFSDRYTVKGDSNQVPSLLRPELRAALLGRPWQHLAASGTVIFWWLEGRLPPPEMLDDFLNQGARVCGLLQGPS